MSSAVSYRYRPNRIVAGLLCLTLLGGFGLHKFYMGYSKSGMVYLLFFWTFFPFVIAVFEGIRYMFMSDEDFEHQYWH